MKSNIIGLAGIKRSGKDTAANALRAAGYVTVAFADAMREEVFAQSPQARTVADEDKEKPQAFLGGKSLREVLIEVGTARRMQDPDYWVKILRNRIRGLVASGKRVCVTDTRLPNEFAMLRELDAFIVWINRPGIEPGAHVTEQDHSSLCDAVMHNDSTPQALHQKLIVMLTQIDMGVAA